MTRDDEFRLRHLADIQAVIARLSQSSFAIRGWSVTLVSIVFAIFVTAGGDHVMIFTTLIPTAIFWTLDAYYLRKERLFRQLHNAAARQLTQPNPDEALAVMPFDMSTDRYRRVTHRCFAPSWCRTFSPFRLCSWCSSSGTGSRPPESASAVAAIPTSDSMPFGNRSSIATSLIR
jgi:hypothetical protein